MTTQKYSLKRTLLENTSSVHSFQETLATSVTTSHFDGYADRFILDHGGCFTILELAIEDREETPVWVNSLHTTNSQGIPDPNCYRKGYAAEMMSLLVQAADQHGIALHNPKEGQMKSYSVGNNGINILHSSSQQGQYDYASWDSPELAQSSAIYYANGSLIEQGPLEGALGLRLVSENGVPTLYYLDSNFSEWSEDQYTPHTPAPLIRAQLINP